MKLATHVVASAILLLATLPALAQQDGRKHIVIGRTPAEVAKSPWSDAVLVGNTLYLSGYIGVDAHNQVPKSAEEETRLALEELKHTVEAAGMSMDDIVKIDVLCTDLSLFPQFNSVYRTYFKNGFPARTFTGSSQLLLGAHFEITGVAIKTGK